MSDLRDALIPVFGALRPPAVLVCYARSNLLRALLIVLALLAGLSRVVVGVHWPVDVAAGLMGGTLAAYAGAWLAERTAATGRKPAVHLVFVIVAAAMAVSLIYSDGGYDAAGLMLRVLAIAALSVAAWSYTARGHVGDFGKITHTKARRHKGREKQQ